MRNIPAALIFAALVLPALPAYAEIAAPCNNTALFPDIDNAITMAASGEVVRVAAGVACDISKKINENTKGVVLIGAGANPTSGSVMVDNILNTSYMMEFTCPTGAGTILAPCRVSGFYFVGGTNSGSASEVVVLKSAGDNSYWRFDNNQFVNIKRTGILFSDAYGAYDHNACIGNFRCMNAFNPSFEGIGAFGDNSIHEGCNWGGLNQIYIESNTFDRGTSTSVSAIIDGWEGMRVVLRFNHIIRAHISNHGVESSGRGRSGACMEIYGNSFDFEEQVEGNFLTNIRGGSVRQFENKTFNWNDATPRSATMNDNRTCHNYGDNKFNMVTGLYAGDSNNPANPLETHVVSDFMQNGEGGTVTVFPDPGWTPNEWITTASVYYAVQRLPAGTNARSAAAITANTSDTITFSGDCHLVQNLVFQIGQTLNINQVYASLDQPGRIGGALVSGGTPPTLPWVSPAGNDQINAPILNWNNINDDIPGTQLVLANAAGSLGVVRVNEHYSNFNAGCVAGGACASGVGAGTSSMPTSCTANQSYFWRTDQGTAWNGNTDAAFYTGDGRLYFCVSTNTWSTAGDGITYEPLAYPHPIVAAASNVPILNDIDPAFCFRSETCPVTITGEDLDGTTETVSVSGTGVTATSCVTVSALSITCDFVVTAGAAGGTRSVTVTVDAVASNALDFDILIPPAPTLTSVLPFSWNPGNIYLVLGVGTDLDGASPVLSVTPSTGITVTSLQVVGTTNLSALITVANDAPLGICAMVFTTADGESNPLTCQVSIPGTGPAGALIGRGGR